MEYIFASAHPIYRATAALYFGNQFGPHIFKNLSIMTFYPCIKYRTIMTIHWGGKLHMDVSYCLKSSDPPLT